MNRLQAVAQHAFDCALPAGGDRQLVADARCIGEFLRAQPVVGGALGASERSALHRFQRREFVAQHLHVAARFFEHLLADDEVFTRGAEFGEAMLHVEFGRFQRGGLRRDAGRELADVVRGIAGNDVARLVVELRRACAQSLQHLFEMLDARSLYVGLALIRRGAFVERFPARLPFVQSRFGGFERDVRSFVFGARGIDARTRFRQRGTQRQDLLFVHRELTIGLLPPLRYRVEIEFELGDPLLVVRDRFFDAGDICAELVVAALDLVELVAVLGVLRATAFDVGVDRALLGDRAFQSDFERTDLRFARVQRRFERDQP